ncbi:endonuclease [Helicobacter pylori]|nr:endonuclease [Helicobacter pylori]MUU60912.1 endonuclease [Helicobacter pylori]MUU95909.1 endonuclease [Helicobacter pylori]
MTPKNMRDLPISKIIFNIRCYAINDFIKKVENSTELLQLNDHLKA